MPVSHISTGAAFLDRALGPECPGIPRGSLTLIYGGTGTGKSILARSIASSAGNSRLRVAYLDAEGQEPRRASTPIFEIGSDRPVDLVSGSFLVPYEYQPATDLERTFNFIQANVHLYDLIVVGGLRVLRLLSDENPSGVASRARFLNAAFQGLRLEDCALLVTYQMGRTGASLPVALERFSALTIELDPPVFRVTKSRYGGASEGGDFNISNGQLGFKPKPAFILDRSSFPDRFNREDPL